MNDPTAKDSGHNLLISLNTYADGLLISEVGCRNLTSNFPRFD